MAFPVTWACSDFLLLYTTIRLALGRHFSCPNLSLTAAYLLPKIYRGDQICWFLQLMSHKAAKVYSLSVLLHRDC